MARWAFKEWASVVVALERGVSDVILRRGGIAEAGDAFDPEHSRFLLMPTGFHQRREQLRAEHRDLYDEALRREPPAGVIRLELECEVRSWRAIRDRGELVALHDRHVYEPWVLEERLAGRYGRALYLLEVSTRRLDQPLVLEDDGSFGGCRSWVELT